MNDNTIKCRYCKAKLPKSYMNDHMIYEHREKLEKTVKKLKIGLAVSFSFTIISIGVTMGLIL